MMLSDACPACFPGDAPAASPHAVCLDDGCLCASYACAACGHAWRTWWDLTGAWPVRREDDKFTDPLSSVLDELSGILATALNASAPSPRRPARPDTPRMRANAR